MTYHFIGIGGIGMSALAKLLLKEGKKVQGSDLEDTDIVKALQKMGAKIAIGHSQKNIQGATSVIYSSATATNPELQIARDKGVPTFHRSEFLFELAKKKKCFMVTGSHGKTTTTSLLASLFTKAGKDPTYVLGGKLLDEEANARLGKGETFVLEGDESDGSFLRAHPEVTIVTSYDPDHLEFWKTEDALKRAYRQVFKNAKKLIWCFEDRDLQNMQPPGICYGFQKECDVRAHHVRYEKNRTLFDVSFNGSVYPDISLSLKGEHNVLNALSVFSLALLQKIPIEIILASFREFPGVHRRMEYIGSNHGIDFIDDYAHHPSEVLCTLKTISEIYRPRRIVSIFEPHRSARFSRCYEQFLQVFEYADVVVVTDVYTAFEENVKKIAPHDFAKKLGQIYIPFDQLQNELPKILEPYDVVVTMGAGRVTDIGRNLVKADSSHWKKIKTILLFGGDSGEHEVSLSSSRYAKKGLEQPWFQVTEIGITKSGRWSKEENIYEKLKKREVLEPKEKISREILNMILQTDMVFPIAHGPNCEDGELQAFFRCLGISCLGDFQACAFSMNKAYVKALAQKVDIPTKPFLHLTKKEWNESKEIAIRSRDELQFPVWVKGCHLGSSLGVFRVVHFADLERAIDAAFEFDSQLIIEEEAVGREIELAVFGHKDYVEVLPPGEVLSQGRVYDYEGKYGESALPNQPIARLPNSWIKTVQKLTKTMYVKAGLSGYARIDFFLDDLGNFFLNEINPHPGLTPTSLFPIMCRAANLSIKDVIDKLMTIALYAKRTRSS